jgi:hypothetical protein
VTQNRRSATGNQQISSLPSRIMQRQRNPTSTPELSPKHGTTAHFKLRAHLYMNAALSEGGMSTPEETGIQIREYALGELTL